MSTPKDSSRCRRAKPEQSRGCRAYRFALGLGMSAALSIQCANYGGEQGLLGFMSLPDVAALLVVTEGSGSSPVESITQVPATTVTGTTSAVTVPTVDMSRSFVVCSQNSGSSQPQNVASCQLTAADEVTINTHTVNGQSIAMSVIQFSSGASVQRGSTTLAAGTATVDLSLSTVNLNRAFVIAYTRLNSTSWADDQERLVTPELVNDSTLRITRGVSTLAMDVDWQVVELDAASVQSGSTTLTAGTASGSATLAPFDLNSSFVLAYVRGDAALAGRENSYSVQTVPTATNELNFVRAQTGGDLNLHYFLVAMNDGSTIQHGSGNVETSYTNTPLKTAAITSVDLTRSIALVSLTIEQPGSPTSDADQDSGLWRVALQNSSTVELERRSAESPRVGALQWQVVQFQN